MDNNDAKYDNLAEKLINLARSERSLASVNGEIANVLDKRDEMNKDYDDLIDKKIKIRKKVANKNRKSMFLNTVVLILATCLMFVLAKITLLELFNLLPQICHIVYGGLMCLVMEYELCICFEDLKNDKKVYTNLEYDEEYINLLQQINNIEKEMKLLDLEYINLGEKRDELISITEYLYEKISSFSQNIGIDAAMEVTSSKDTELEIGDAQGKELVKRKIK